MELALGQLEVEGARHGVDLDGRDQLQPVRERSRVRGRQLAVRGEVVVVGDGEQANPGVVCLANELRGLQDAIRAKRVGVDVRDRVAGGERLAVRAGGMALGHR